jgi:hypothetical protein
LRWREAGQSMKSCITHAAMIVQPSQRRFSMRSNQRAGTGAPSALAFAASASRVRDCAFVTREPIRTSATPRCPRPRVRTLLCSP